MSIDEPTAHEAIRVAAASDRLWRAADLDVPAGAMSRMYREGVLERIIPGVYLGTRNTEEPLTEAAAWILKHPAAVACLLTAAVYHDLSDAFAGGTWLHVPKGASPPRNTVVPVQTGRPSTCEDTPGTSLGNTHWRPCDAVWVPRTSTSRPSPASPDVSTPPRGGRWSRCSRAWCFDEQAAEGTVGAPARGEPRA